MRTIIRGLLVALVITTSIASADILNEEDDTYIGFQLTTQLDSKNGGFLTGRSEYSYLLIEQKNSIKSGITFTLDSDGNRFINYLTPSATFDIGESSISEYVIPIMKLDAEASSTSNSSTSNVVGGLAVLAVVGLWIKHDLEKPWRPASPD